MEITRKIKTFPNKSNLIEKIKARYNLGYRLRKRLNHKPKVGIAVLIWERADYLKPCLESLFKTKLYNYDVTFLLNDDGSKDPKVREIIEKERGSKYKIIRNYTPKGHPSWGAAFNKAIKKLLEIDNFDIVGTCDSDVLFNPEWLDKSIKTFLWAKKNHKDHKLIKFSAFNSSDFVFHNILGTYKSPYGKYVVKERMGDVTNMFFTEDLFKVGLYAEDKNDETLKTEFFKNHGLRYFSTEISYAEHIGQVSLLNQWRPTPVENAVHAMHPASNPDWDEEVKKYRIHKEEYYLDFDRQYNRLTFFVNFKNSFSTVLKLFEYSKKIYRKTVKKNKTLYKEEKALWNRKLAFLSHQYNVSISKDLQLPAKSQLTLDIIITAIERDLPVLKHSLHSIKENLLHPINAIKIISPENKEIYDFCKKNKCEFVNERDVLPISPKDIDYFIGGYNRSGWLFQQLLKLSGDKVSDQKHYMVFDSDTILLRPQAFEQNGKYIFDLSDEYHEAYFKVYQKLTGLYPKSPFSFVAHHMLFEKKVLEEFKKLIERKHNKSWMDAILECTDRQDISGFSEFESYGNYFFEKERDRMILKYWYNLSVGRTNLSDVQQIILDNKDRYNTLSFQYYNN